jgi:hypothetical protein
MKTYKLREDVFSESLDAKGCARSEGWLPAGTVVQPVATGGNDSLVGRGPLGNRVPGLTVRVVTTADGEGGAGLARENLCGVRRIEDVADPVEGQP